MDQVPEEKRRTPQQGRSLATIDAIFEAASQVLEANGVEGFNTNLVAERAGVSIGTLYQYFANKDDIVIGMVRREADTLRKAVTKHLAHAQGRQHSGRL